jgi:hypothetical protein
MVTINSLIIESIFVSGLDIEKTNAPIALDAEHKVSIQLGIPASLLETN